jgi:hypothetical protein
MSLEQLEDAGGREVAPLQRQARVGSPHNEGVDGALGAGMVRKAMRGPGAAVRFQLVVQLNTHASHVGQAQMSANEAAAEAHVAEKCHAHDFGVALYADGLFEHYAITPTAFHVCDEALAWVA